MISLPYIGASVGVRLRADLRQHSRERDGQPVEETADRRRHAAASTIVAANYVPTGRDGVVILIMSIASSGKGHELGWTVVRTSLPRSSLVSPAGSSISARTWRVS